MALSDVLGNVPGLAGYLGQQQFDQQRQGAALQQLLGVASMVEQQKQRAMQGQMQQAQLGELLRKAEAEKSAQERMTMLGQQFRALQQPRTETDAADNVTTAPGFGPDDALRRVVPEMVFDPNAAVRQSGSQLAGRLELVDAQRANAAAALEQRREALEARSRDQALNREQRAKAARQADDTRRMIAQMTNAVAQSSLANRRDNQDSVLKVIDPANPNRIIGMRESEYFRRREAGENLALASSGLGASANQQSSRLASLQREMEISHPNIKDLNKIKPQFTAAAEYMRDLAVAQKEGKKPPITSSEDRALYYQFQKTIDPQDKITEGDHKRKLQLGGIDERFVQYIVGLERGDTLPDRVRQDIFNAMRRRYETLNQQTKTVEERYRQRAKSQGLNPDDLVRVSE